MWLVGAFVAIFVFVAIFFIAAASFGALVHFNSPELSGMFAALGLVGLLALAWWQSHRVAMREFSIRAPHRRFPNDSGYASVLFVFSGAAVGLGIFLAVRLAGWDMDSAVGLLLKAWVFSFAAQLAGNLLGKAHARMVLGAKK